MDTDNPVRPVKPAGIWALCGFEGWGSPLYAIESYQYTPFSGSILLFYGLICGLKAIGFSVTALLLILLSACFQKSLYPCLMGLGLGVVLNYCWLGALPVWWKQALSCISPFTLTSGSKLLKACPGEHRRGIFAPAFCGSDRSEL